MSKEANIEWARKLVDLLYPLVELTVLDAHGSVKEIYNAFSGLRQDQECDVVHCQKESPFPELLSVGRSVRSLLTPFFKGKQVSGYLRLRYDLTCFKTIQEQLNLVIQKETVLPENTTGTWKESIEQEISYYLRLNKINVLAITPKQKRELIIKLQNKGLLDFKESSVYVASKLQISRATVYNYLKTASCIKKVHIHQVDAFTNQKFGGNPAGVVLDADALDETTMRKIARELNLSETAFVLQSKKSTFRMRYFTPTGHEIAFCGHSSVGALYMIAKEKRFGIEKAGNYTFDVETLSGVLKMETKINKQDEIQIAYEAPQIKLKPLDLTHEEVAKAAGFELNLIDRSYPVMYEETSKDLFVTISSLENLKKVECDPKSFAHFSKQHDLVALCLLTPEAFDRGHQFHMRCFAPLVGITEDPFTGSVLGGLAAYVDNFGLLAKGNHSFKVEQGHFIQRPGAVYVEFSKKRGHYQAKIFAQAVHCFSTELNLI